jgi:hypothetical protein
MRTIMAPILWLGRITLWILILPLGIWRSLVHHRKKGERRMEKRMEKMLAERERDSRSD